MSTERAGETPLASLLGDVWREQNRVGFLLADPDHLDAEIRRVPDSISGVVFRFRWLPHRNLRSDVAELESRGILSADRDEASLFGDPRDAPGRFCFLCPSNIRVANPLEVLVPLTLAGEGYVAGANFAWISNEHFTVMASEHTDQVFSGRALEAMLDLHAQTGGRFRIIYNGAHAGATISWHLHYQITSEALPVEELPAGREAAYPTAIRRFTADAPGGGAQAYASAWVAEDPAHHRVNVLVAGPRSSPTISVFPRDTRKSHAAGKGLMGGFEVSGDFVYGESGSRASFETATAHQARSLLEAIRPSGT